MEPLSMGEIGKILQIKAKSYAIYTKKRPISKKKLVSFLELVM